MDAEQLTNDQGHALEGPLLIKPRVFGDDRGWFYESWNQRSFNEAVGEEVVFGARRLRRAHPQGYRIKKSLICYVFLDLR